MSQDYNPKLEITPENRLPGTLTKAQRLASSIRSSQSNLSNQTDQSRKWDKLQTMIAKISESQNDHDSNEETLLEDPKPAN